MRILDIPVSPPEAKGSPRTSGNQRRRAAAALAVTSLVAALALVGCGGGKIGKPVAGFAGVVAAAEPNAALVGRDVLASGGNAADAVVAMGFALAVTYPSQVGLGAGGVCIVHDHNKKTAEALDFTVPAGAGTVPALPRGLFALAARYGSMRWEQVTTPAEQMARFGITVSRALAQQWPLAAPTVFRSGDVPTAFAGADGRPLAEGAVMSQPALGAVLSLLRRRGVGEFYSGSLSRQVEEAVAAAGGSLTDAKLRGFEPRWYAPIVLSVGSNKVFFAPSPSGSVVAAETWAHLVRDGAWSDAPAAERGRLLAETWRRLSAERANWHAVVPVDSLLARDRLAAVLAVRAPTGAAGAVNAGAGVVAVDRQGSAAACAFSLNRPFGTGRVAGGLGFLPAAPADGGSGMADLAPMLIVNTNSDEFRLAAAAGQNGVAAQLDAAIATMVGNRPLAEAVASAAGAVGGTAPAGVLAAHCSSGKPDPSRCAAAIEPGAFGLGMTVGIE